MIPKMNSQHIPWSEIKLLVFDVDGTLYSQPPVRYRMAVDLAVHSLVNRELRTLKIIREYRSYREDLTSNQGHNNADAQIKRLSHIFDRSAEDIKHILDEWMGERPLKYLHAQRHRSVSKVLALAAEQDIAVAVLSDLPLGRKIEALEMTFLSAHCTDEYNEFKPGTKTLSAIMEKFEAGSNSTLVIGDRDNRDGRMAENSGCFYFKARTNKDFDRLFSHMAEAFK